jgi:hypothetical protein
MVHHLEGADQTLTANMFLHLQELARPDGSPADVDGEFALMFAVAHERKTFFSAENLETFLPGLTGANSTDLDDLQSMLMDADDSEDDSDLFYAINGV